MVPGIGFSSGSHLLEVEQVEVALSTSTLLLRYIVPNPTHVYKIKH